MDDVVICASVRTPVGGHVGALATVEASRLGALVASAALDRSGVPPELVDQVVFGNVLHTEAGSAYLARLVGLGAGLPDHVPAVTVNRLCGSGLEAVIQARHLIAVGEADVVLAGGTESMSQAPHWAHLRRGRRLGDLKLTDSLSATLEDPRIHMGMGMTAEILAREFEIDRETQDRFARESQRRAADAIATGRFAGQTVAVDTGRTRLDADEGVRGDTTMEALAALPPAFTEGGTVTAGNASRLSDGAAAALLARRPAADRLSLPVMGAVRGWATVGVDPAHMGLGPAKALPIALERAGIAIGDLDVIELNEAFAAQSIAVIRALGLDTERTNPNGGAIALGHPLGATGAILLAKCLYELARAGGRYGAVTLCIGGGQGIALVVERAQDWIG